MSFIEKINGGHVMHWGDWFVICVHAALVVAMAAIGVRFIRDGR